MSPLVLTPVLLYALKMMLVSTGLFGYYWLFLRNAAFHPYNRWYLLASTATALLLPLLPLPAAWPAMEAVILPTSGQAIAANPHTPLLALAGHASSGGGSTIVLIYALISAFFLLRLLPPLFRIGRLALKYPRTRMAGVSFYETDAPGTPFSFGNRLFWNRELPLDTENGQAILRHELAHIHERHTLDILALETLRALFWINPVFHLTLLEIRLVHEFLADRRALSTGGDPRQYAECLLWLSAGAPHPLRLTHSFFHKHLKRRITMIIQTKQSPRYLSRVLALPVLFLLFSAFAVRKAIPHNGPSSLEHFFMKRLRYPQEALSANKEGTVWFAVKVDADGNFADFHPYASEADLGAHLGANKPSLVTVTSRPASTPGVVGDKKASDFLDEARSVSKRIGEKLEETEKKWGPISAGEYIMVISFRIEKP